MKFVHQNPPIRQTVMAAVIVLALSIFVSAASLTTEKPERLGLSSVRLERLSRGMQEYIDQGKTAGIVALVARKGQVAYLKAFGKLDPVKGIPLPVDAIFRIASQTKAVTTVAVMMLLEEGRLLLDDPVSKYIPEFASTSVAVQAPEKEAKGYTRVPAKRPITVRDLLTHTAGISYGDGPAESEYVAAGVRGWFMADKPIPIGEVVKKIATLPFNSQPGEKWVYGFNSDILGYLIERVSGMTLSDFFARKITGPLGMNDTHFFLPKEKIGRFTPVYGADEKGQIKLVEDPTDSFYVKGPRVCFAGGSGLLSTAGDYARFLMMLEQGGEYAGVRLLSPKTVELLTADHASSLYGSEGYGLGFWVTDRLGRNGQPGTVGAFGWGGAYHTTYFVDPGERLVAVLMTQLLPAGNIDLQPKFKTLVYQSIVASYEKRWEDK
jgi:CubicO group peptidase (beta-lactamase class C family)